MNRNSLNLLHIRKNTDFSLQFSRAKAKKIASLPSVLRCKNDRDAYRSGHLPQVRHAEAPSR